MSKKKKAKSRTKKKPQKKNTGKPFKKPKQGVGKKATKKKPAAKGKSSPVKSLPTRIGKKSAGPAPKSPEKPILKSPGSSASAPPPRQKPLKSGLEDLPLDLEEKEELVEEEKKELARALADDESLETAFVPTDTSERYILVVDEEGRRRTETTTIISQILPNAIIEVADDPEEALEMMQDCEFDTFVVNFLMPGYSASSFVKAVANHFEHPLLIGFAADKISDAVDPKKGLKIIPLKRLFDLDASTAAEPLESEGARRIP